MTTFRGIFSLDAQLFSSTPFSTKSPLKLLFLFKFGLNPFVRKCCKKRNFSGLEFQFNIRFDYLLIYLFCDSTIRASKQWIDIDTFRTEFFDFRRTNVAVFHANISSKCKVPVIFSTHYIIKCKSRQANKQAILFVPLFCVMLQV